MILFSAFRVVQYISLLVAVLYVLEVSHRVSADDNIDLRKKQAIAQYVGGAFAQSDKLIKPERFPRISYYCPGKFCNNLVVTLKSDFPMKTEQLDAPTLNTEADIRVLMFPSLQALSAENATFTRQEGDKVAILDDGKCSLIRVTRGEIVTQVIIRVVVDAQLRESELCVLEESLRGTGLVFPDRFSQYAAKYSKQDDAEYQTTIKGYRNLAVLHWSDLTRPGMNRVEVTKALEAIELR